MKFILDTYGADAGTLPIIKGAALALAAHPGLELVLVGNENDIRSALGELPAGLSILHTEDFISNHEPAMCIFNGRDESSTAIALKHLKEDPAIAGMLTAGNTGAVLVGSIFRLGLKKGLKSPALSSAIPQAGGGYAVLVDCGANVDCTAKDLVNFAVLGSEFAGQMYGLERPRVALLNVGKEPGKGNPLMLEAYKLLSEKEGINFIGNIEGCDISLNQADVIVADGFTGNIVLKEVEATGKLAMKLLENAAAEDGTAETETVRKAMAQMYSLFEMNKRGGATFLGTAKPIVKMHGVATEETVVACVEQLLCYFGC